MKSHRGQLAVAMAVCIPCCLAVPPQENAHQAQIDLARQRLRFLVAGDYGAFVEASDPIMKNALPAEKLEQVWMGLVRAYGPYQAELKANAAPLGAYLVVDLVSGFESGSINVRITLNKEDQTSGLFFRPLAAEVDYQPPEYVDEARFREQRVTVSPGSMPLPGTLTIPKGKGPFPAVVLVHGSGPQDQDETIHRTKPFKDLAWGLASRGVAVLRYDKRTHRHGASMDARKITIDEETADDAISAVRILLERDDIDSKRVLLLGHSLGATAAPYIAVKERQIGGLIMLAAAARPLYELVEDQMAYLSALGGPNGEEAAGQLPEIRKRVQALRDGTWQPDETLLGAPSAYWASLDCLKPVATAKKLAIPVLIVQGGRDYQVDPQKDFGLWQEALSGCSHVTFKLFEKMDHLFHAGEGPSTPAQYQEVAYVDGGVIRYLADWILALDPGSGADPETRTSPARSRRIEP